MHNSGTSLVASLLHAAGMPMGDRLLFRRTIPADRRPRYDYFEDGDVVALQDATGVVIAHRSPCQTGKAASERCFENSSLAY